MNPLTLRSALVLMGLVAAPAAHATHDVGRGYHLLRIADSGATLVAACDIQDSDAPILTVRSRTGRLLATVPPPGSQDVAYAMCGDPAKLEALLPDAPALAAAIARHGLVHLPVFDRSSPDRRHHLFVAIDGTRADVELLAAGSKRAVATARLHAKPGLSSHLFGLEVAWHPDGRFAVLVGQIADGVVPSCQVWTPLLRVFRAPATKTGAAPLAPERFADRYLRWAAVRTARCERLRDAVACTIAEDAIRAALRVAPRYQPAQDALDATPWN